MRVARRQNYDITQIINWQFTLRDHFVYALSQREMTLQCNTVSHWLSLIQNDPWLFWDKWCKNTNSLLILPVLRNFVGCQGTKISSYWDDCKYVTYFSLETWYTIFLNDMHLSRLQLIVMHNDLLITSFFKQWAFVVVKKSYIISEHMYHKSVCSKFLYVIIN